MATTDVKIIDGDGHIVEDISAIIGLMPPPIRKNTEDATRTLRLTTCIPLTSTICPPAPSRR